MSLVIDSAVKLVSDQLLRERVRFSYIENFSDAKLNHWYLLKNFGEAQGKHKDFLLNLASKHNLTTREYVPTGGESYEDVYITIYDFILEIPICLLLGALKKLKRILDVMFW